MNPDELGIKKKIGAGYEQVLPRVVDALKAHGFGILTEIDVKQTLHEKLGVDFRRYRILGACHPPSAHEVLKAEPEIGLLLPCNVIVYELSADETMVSAFDPIAMAGDVPAIESVARDVRSRLERALQALG
jgi:uncharacterized protein (DUF302 family)